MIDRIMGVITLKAPVYREIADDQSGTQSAGIIVVVVSLLLGLSNGIQFMARLNGGVLVVILYLIVALVLGLIGWIVAGWTLAAVAKAMGGKTDTGEMLRVTGYVRVFDLVSILSLATLVSRELGCITAPVLIVSGIASIVGYVIGVREAAEFSTGNAVVAAVVAGVINLVITVVIGGAIAAALVGAAALTGSR